MEEICNKKRIQIQECRRKIEDKTIEVLNHTLEFENELYNLSTSFIRSRELFNVKRIEKNTHHARLKARDKQRNIEQLEQQHKQLLNDIQYITVPGEVIRRTTMMNDHGKCMHLL